MRLSKFLSALSFWAGISRVMGNEAYELGRSTLKARTSDLSFCYGDNAICSISLDIHDQCDRFSNDFDNMKPLYDCLCGNGYVSASEACNWCQEVYGISNIYFDYRKNCEKYNASVAPLPSAVREAYSSWNATYTGIISGASADATNLPATAAQTTGNPKPSSTPTHTAKPSSAKITTGVTLIQTFSGVSGDDLLPANTLGPPSFTGPFAGGDDRPTSVPTASSVAKAGGDASGAASKPQAILGNPNLAILFGMGLFLVHFL